MPTRKTSMHGYLVTMVTVRDGGLGFMWFQCNGDVGCGGVYPGGGGDIGKQNEEGCVVTLSFSFFLFVTNKGCWSLTVHGKLCGYCSAFDPLTAIKW